MVAFILGCLLFILAPPVWAHPVDALGDVRQYDQKQDVTITPESTTLTIGMTFYPLDKIKIWESIDTNRDQEISTDEKTTWMHKGENSSWFTQTNKRIEVTATELQFPQYYEFFSTKPADVVITFITTSQLLENTDTEYWYQGVDKKLDEIPFSIKGSDGIAVTNIEKIAADSVGFHITQGESSSFTIDKKAAASKTTAFVNKYIKTPTLPWHLALWAMVAAAAIGALHALTPGHGKAILASFLIGSHGTIFHAIQLGLTITITHTASVFLLGLSVLLLSSQDIFAPVISALDRISAILVIGFGLVLVIQRFKDLRKGSIIHEHTHNHDHDHNHHHAVSLRQITWLGVSGGIVPCVDAMAIVLVAVSLGKIGFGMLLLVAFSIGLSLGLISIGVATVIAHKHIARRMTGFSRIQPYVGIMSAVVVTLLGVALLLRLPV